MKAKMMAMMLLGKKLDFDVATKTLGEGLKKNVHQIREHHHILKLARQPDQVQRVLVDRDLLSQGRRVVGTQPGAAVGVDADAKEADARLQVGVAGEAGQVRVGGVVDLCRVGVGCVVIVVEGEEEDVGDERAGGGAACE